MAHRQTPPPKKPTGSRPQQQRKLTSYDSAMSKTSSASTPSTSSSAGDPANGRTFGHASPLRSINGNSGAQESAQESVWSGLPLVESPRVEEKEVMHSKSSSQSSVSIYSQPSPRPSKTSYSHPRPAPISTITPQLTIPAAIEDNPPPSPTPSARWANLRQAVLPHARPTTPTSHHTQQSTSSSTQTVFHTAQSSQSSNTVPPRSTTPKPSRLAKLGFKGVVEHVGAQMSSSSSSSSSTRKLADEILQACHAARFANSVSSGKHGKVEAYVGSNFLPFTSTTQPLRRPQSQQSLTTVASKAGSKPTLQHLYTTLILHSQTQTQYQHQYARLGVLPHEMQVLSALLIPFVVDPGRGDDGIGADMDGGTVGDEMWLSTETFGVLVKAWPSVTPESSLARIIHLIKAALSRSSLRPKLVALLSSFMSTSNAPNAHYTPTHLQTIFQGLFMLLSTLSLSGASDVETGTVRNLIAHFRPELNKQSFQTEYGVSFEYGTEFGSSENNMPAVIREILLEALGKALQNVGEYTRRYMLTNLIEEYWPRYDVSPQSTTLLINVMHTKAINTFARAFLLILNPPPTIVGAGADSPNDLFTPSIPTADTEVRLSAQVIRHLLSALLVPSLLTDDCMPSVVRVVLEMLCVDTTCLWASERLVAWWKDDKWKSGVQTGIQKLLTESSWTTSVRLLLTLVEEMPENDTAVVESLISYTLPVLFNQLTTNPPPQTSHPALEKLMMNISFAHPPAFYKPLVSLASSNSERSVKQHLATLLEIDRFVPDWWRRDAEMMSVVIMSDMAGKAKGKAKEGARRWGQPRLGQSVLVVEVISKLKEARLRKEDGSEKRISKTPGLEREKDRSFVETVKFVAALETRLGILLEAKEKHTLVPPSQRRLFSVLFLEMRLLTRSLKRATFLPLTVSWFLESHIHQQICADNPNDMDNYDELRESTRKLGEVYEDIVNFGDNQNRSTTLSPNLQTSFHPASTNPNALTSLSESRLQFILSINTPEEIAPQFLELLVALSGLLAAEDYSKMGKWLWRTCLDGNDNRVVAPACFMIMQCAEKIEDTFLHIVKDDLQSEDSEVKILAIQRISTLSNWRFQLLSQPIIVDRAHRRPFKLTRGPLPFIATDIGSPLYVRQADMNPYPAHLYQKKAKEAMNSSDRTNASEVKKANADMPLELRKRLAEIGWAQEELVVDEKLEWIFTPMSLLPNYELDRGMSSVDPGSPSSAALASPKKHPGDAGDGTSGLLRRKSSTGGSTFGLKRRAVFVPALATIFPLLASLVFDSQFSVASAARGTIMDIMRNDPGLLTRPIFDLLADNQQDMSLAISTLRAFLHIRRVLPPGMAYHVFNSLAGFLKFAARQVDGTDTLKSFAYTLPILSKLVMQVSEMSIREIRRGKVEIFLIPSGSLWFSASAPSGPMFPQQLGNSNSTDPVPPTLVGITMIRLAQNMTFLAMLKRKPQDVQMIRKSMSRLVLPFRDPKKVDATPLELTDYIPRRTIAERERVNSFALDGGVRALSLMLSRSYLLLVAQVFRSMSRHLNDRNELAVLVDGLNRILLVHGDDIGIVSQAMIALMVASTRFRRLFTSGGGYTLFMPMVVKVYTESERHEGIKLAIEYAINRFYALHQEAFVFQTLDIVAHIMMVPDIESDWIAKSVYTLFAVLRKGILPSTPDAAGIHNANRLQEREALMVTTAEEKPQTFLAAFSRSESGHDYSAFVLPEEYESERLGIDNFVRLFLTVIAHDPTILRAEQFLRFLRFLTPYLYHATSSARSILKEGVDALGVVLTRATGKAKNSDSILKPVVEYSVEVLATEAILENQLLDKSKSPSNIFDMRMDYFSLVVAFIRAGGQLDKETSQRTIDLVKVMLRDSATEDSKQLGSFLNTFARCTLLRDGRPTAKEVVSFLTDFVPLLRAHGIGVDFSGTFETISELAADARYANDETFSRLVVTQICAAGLGASEIAASEKMLLALPLRRGLVSLLANAICLRGADMIGEVEKQAPTYDFLTGIILPLVLSMKTTAEVVSEGKWTEGWRRSAHARTWVRLFAYVMSACYKREPVRDGTHLPERMKSQSKRHSTTSRKSHMATVVTAIQVIKAIVVRAEDDLSSCLPGIWSRIAILLKSLLGEGNGDFTLSPHDYSPFSSPIHSPRASAYFEQNTPSSSNFRSPSGKPTLPPRIVDYSMWSLFELLCLTRSALMVQMRIFLQEKVATLDQELRHQVGPGIASSRDRRISSSMFSKPRRRISVVPPSEPNSPGLNASQSSPARLGAPVTSNNLVRQPGYQNFRSSLGSSQEPSGLPKIVHLGPVGHIPAAGLSPGLGSNIRAMGNTARIKSLSLVRVTYERIRLVMLCMGYDHSSLPPFAGERKLDEQGITWTKRHALDAIVTEMKDLMEEFNETFQGEDDDMVVVDADQSMSF